MGFAEEIAAAGAKIMALDELDLPGGTAYLAPYPVEHNGHTYQHRLGQSGIIQRRLSRIGGGLERATFSVSIANEDGALNKQDIAKSLNRAYTRKMLANGQVQVFFSGLADLAYEQGRIQAQIYEQWEKYLGETNRWYERLRLKAEDWPGLPQDDVGRMAQVIFGAHDSRGSGYKGMLPTIELSPTLRLAAGHACKSVIAVFDSGKEQLTGYSVHTDYPWPSGINGMATVIEFSSPPEGSVTCDAQGFTSTRTSEGELLVCPVDQAEAFREHFLGMPSSIVDAASIAAARAHCQAYGLRSARRIDTEAPGRDVMSELLASFFLFGGGDANGKWGIKFLDYPFANGGGTAISERLDIVADSFQAIADPDSACNDLTVQYLQTGGAYKGELNLADATSQVDLQGTYQQRLQLPWVADPITARTIGEWMLHHLKRGAASASWGEQLHHSAVLDLGGQVAITHGSGPDDGGAGWDAAEHLITEMELDLLQAGLRVEAMDIRQWTQAALGDHAELGDSLPMVVL